MFQAIRHLEVCADGSVDLEGAAFENQEETTLLKFTSDAIAVSSQSETISTSFVELTVSQVISKRFVKQQMQWTPRGAKPIKTCRRRLSVAWVSGLPQQKIGYEPCSCPHLSLRFPK
jgi:hypothetical protein